MRVNQMDSYLKEIARNEELIMPNRLEEQISRTMKKLPRRRRFLKPAITAASLFLAALLALTAINPSYAANLPILKSVFKFFGQSGDYTQSQYAKYAAPVNMSVTDQGYTVTVNELAADDSYVVMSYTVNSPNGFSEKFAVDPYLLGTLSESGRRLVNGTGRTERVDANTYAGYISYFVGKEAGKLPDNLKLNYTVEHIDSVAGKWSIDFKAAKQGAAKDSTITNANILSELPGAKVQVNKVVFSPFADSVMLNVEYANYPDHYGYFILDDKGESLQVTRQALFGSYLKSNIPGQKRFAAEETLFFVKGKRSTKELTLVPYKLDRDYDLRPVEFLSASLKNLPATFTPGNETKLTVTKVNYSTGSAEIHYTIDGMYPSGYAVRMVLIDEGGKNIFPNDGDGMLIDPDSREFVVRFEGLDSSQNYKVATPRLNDLQVFTDQKITIPLN